MKDLIGKRIRLLAMPGDPDPVPAGSTGIIRDVAGIEGRWSIMIDWDEGVNRSLNLCHPPDEFEFID